MGKRHNEDEQPQVVANEYLLEAFADTFVDAKEEFYSDVVMDYAALRQYFGAMRVPKEPDPLPPYLDALPPMGYPFRTTFDGQPALFLKRRHKQERHCAPLFTAEEQNEELNYLDGPEPVLLPDQVNVTDRRSDKTFARFPDLEPIEQVMRDITES